MRLRIKVILFLYGISILNLSKLYGSAEGIACGYGREVLSGSGESIIYNSSQIAELNENQNYIFVNFRKPGEFQYFGVVLTPVISEKTYQVGFSIIQNTGITSYNLSFYLFNFSQIFFGSKFSLIKQKVRPFEKDNKYSFTFSPGMFVDFGSIKERELKFGAVMENLFNTLDSKVEVNLFSGLGVYDLFEDFDLFLGIRLQKEDFDFSGGIEYGVNNNLSLYGGYSTETKLGIGGGYRFTSSRVVAGISTDLKDFNYEITYEIYIPEKETKKGVRRRVTRAVLNKQKRLLQEGLQYYREKEYKKAKKVWLRAYRLAPYTRYGQKARKYLNKVNKILKVIE